MSSRSPTTRLMFGSKKQRMKTEDAKIEDASVVEGSTSKDAKRAKGHSQDADRHAKVAHQKSEK